MGDQRLTPEEGEDPNGSSPISIDVLFKEEFPHYLAMGMTPEEYWHGEADLPVHYRKAETIKRSKKNRELWLQGRYFYDAIVCAFSADAARENQSGYLDEPYPTTHEEADERQRRLEKAQYERDLAQMKAWTEAWNRHYESEVAEHGGN